MADILLRQSENYGGDIGREELIACFRDTLEKSYCASLRKKTLRAIESNRVYREGFIRVKNIVTNVHR